MSALTFQPIAIQKRRAKVILIGEPGVGKTHAALTFPRPAVIDAEGSADWFADRFAFVAVPTKSYREVRALVQSVREGRVACDTLIIDSLTSIYNSLVNEATVERQTKSAKNPYPSDDLRPLDWGRIKRKFSSLLDELYHKLPCNVVCVGWIKPEYAKPGDMIDGKKVNANDLVKIGEQFDGDRKTLYAFDFAFKILGNDGKRTRALVLKTRSGQLKTGQVIEDFSYKTLSSLIPNAAETTYHGMTDDEAQERDRGVVAEEEGDAPTPPQPPPEVPPHPYKFGCKCPRCAGIDAIHKLKIERNVPEANYRELLVELFGQDCLNDQGKPTTTKLSSTDLRAFYAALNKATKPSTEAAK